AASSSLDVPAPGETRAPLVPADPTSALDSPPHGTSPTNWAAHIPPTATSSAPNGNAPHPGRSAAGPVQDSHNPKPVVMAATAATRDAAPAGWPARSRCRREWWDQPARSTWKSTAAVYVTPSCSTAMAALHGPAMETGGCTTKRPGDTGGTTVGLMPMKCP